MYWEGLDSRKVLHHTYSSALVISSTKHRKCFNVRELVMKYLCYLKENLILSVAQNICHLLLFFLKMQLATSNKIYFVIVQTDFLLNKVSDFLNFGDYETYICTWVVYVKIIAPHCHFQSLLPAFKSMVVWMWIASSDSCIWILHLQFMELFGSLRRYGLVRGCIPLCGSRSLVPFTLCSLHFVMNE